MAEIWYRIGLPLVSGQDSLPSRRGEPRREFVHQPFVEFLVGHRGDVTDGEKRGIVNHATGQFIESFQRAESRTISWILRSFRITPSLMKIMNAGIQLGESTQI
jgi:hypothetical protein